MKRIKKAELRKNELQFDIPVVKKFITDNPDSKIYIGCDSTRTGKTRVRFATVICIHYKGHGGAKVFGEISYEDIKDATLGRPINRMLTEVDKIIKMFKVLEEVLTERVDDLSIHIDISPDKKQGSNIAYGAAMGIIEGTLGIKPMAKPEAFAASFAADRYCNKSR